MNWYILLGKMSVNTTHELTTYCTIARTNRGMILAVSIGLAVAAQVSAEPLLNTAIRSHTGQFTVQSVRRQYVKPNGQPFRASMAGGWAFMVMPPSAPHADEAAQKIDPGLLVASCERIKEAILRELSLPDRWRDQVDLNLNSSLAEDADPALRIVPAPMGFRYELELPASMRPRHLSRAIVSVTLLEMANRSATSEPTEIPFWLVEGMMAQVQANDSTLLLRPNLTTVSTMLLEYQKKPLLLLLSSRRLIQDPRFIAQLRRLGSRTPLTFQELSWPTKEQIAGSDEEFYQACAHLFLYELLQMNDGRISLCRFLELLPSHLNWQISFLEAYPARFDQLRDVEKWWGLALMQGAGYSAARWSVEESVRRFQETLEIPTLVRLSSAEMPDTGKTTLQEVILRWDAANQTAMLQRAYSDLVTLRSRLAPEFLPLADRYCRVIEGFLRENSPNALAWMRVDSAPRQSREAAARQLTQADRQLDEMRTRLAAGSSK